MMASINDIILAHSVSVIGLCVLGIFGGAGIAARFDGKIGGIIMVISAVVLVHTLRVLRILPF